MPTNAEVAIPFAIPLAAVVALVAEKDRVYRGSWKKHGEVLSIFANVTRKTDRLDSLLSGTAAGASESLTDTVADLAGYGLLWLTWVAEHEPAAVFEWHSLWKARLPEAELPATVAEFGGLLGQRAALRGERPVDFAFCEERWRRQQAQLEEILLRPEQFKRSEADRAFFKLLAIAEMTTAALEWLELARRSAQPARSATYTAWAAQWVPSAREVSKT